MARGIVEVPAGGMPKDDREWARFLRALNELIKVSNAPPGIVVTLAPGSVPLTSLANIAGVSLLGRATGEAGAVQSLTAAQVATIIQSEINHGSIGGLGDNDHPQYVLGATLTTDGDLFVRLAGEVSRLGIGADGQVLGVVGGVLDWVTQDVSSLSGTYTGTFTGTVTNPTLTVRYTKVGQLVTLYVPQTTATSNDVLLTITGAPAEICPARASSMLAIVQDNGVLSFGKAQMQTDGTLDFGVGPGGLVFTNTGTKGVELQDITYSLD